MTTSDAPIISTAKGNKVLLPINEEDVAEYVEKQRPYVECILNQINNQGIYDFAFSGRDHLTFLDLGAHIGLVSAYASDVCDRIVAVEPSPATFLMLRRIAKHFPNITAKNVAISGSNDECILHVNDVNTTASSVVNTFGTPVGVPGTTLPALIESCKLEHVDFCKMDIEGSELDALPLDTIASLKNVIDCYFIETHNCPSSTWEYKMGELVKSFVKVGYRIVRSDGMAIIFELPPKPL